MVASASDKLLKVGNPGSATTLSSPGYTIGATSITVGSTSNWATDTGVVFAIDEAEVVNGVEVQIAGTYNEYIGTVASGTSVTNVDWALGSGDRNYASGALTRVYIPVSAERENRIVEWGTVEHDQDGTHKNITTDTLTTSGNVTINGTLTIGGSGSSGGWSPISGTVTAVAANGNRSYNLTTSADNSTAISPGMRLRTTRTVAAPTQSTSLNGTTQYYSKTTPSAMTFTDDFVVSAWVKLSSYQAGTIVSRYNGTSGFDISVTSSGQVQVLGLNGGAGNYKITSSYQSIPLNKWVHIAAQLDMSAITGANLGLSTTTNFIMLDGVDVPCASNQAGTNPAALAQAGNLEIGSRNGGTQPFPGKIAQVAIYNAKVTQATIKASMNQTLSGSETSLISAYSFNGVITDLSANANNLTANGSAVATNADSPFGGQADGTISSTLDYGIIQSVSASTIVTQVAEGCTIPTTGGVSAVSYSSVKTPYGFPTEKGKWRLSTLLKSVISTTSNATYGSFLGGGYKIVVPIGAWEVGQQAGSYFFGAVDTYFNLSPVSLTGLNNVTGADASPLAIRGQAPAGTTIVVPGKISSPVTLTSATAYTMWTFGATTGSGISGNVSLTEIFAENAYL